MLIERLTIQRATERKQTKRQIMNPQNTEIYRSRTVIKTGVELMCS